LVLLVPLSGRDSTARLKAERDIHSVKFPVAIFENYRWISPAWRPHFMAAASYALRGADATHTQVIMRVRYAMSS
jgi:hypothetical protein